MLFLKADNSKKFYKSKTENNKNIDLEIQIEKLKNENFSLKENLKDEINKFNEKEKSITEYIQKFMSSFYNKISFEEAQKCYIITNSYVEEDILKIQINEFFRNVKISFINPSFEFFKNKNFKSIKILNKEEQSETISNLEITFESKEIMVFNNKTITLTQEEKDNLNINIKTTKNTIYRYFIFIFIFLLIGLFVFYVYENNEKHIEKNITNTNNTIKEVNNSNVFKDFNFSMENEISQKNINKIPVSSIKEKEKTKNNNVVKAPIPTTHIIEKTETNKDLDISLQEIKFDKDGKKIATVLDDKKQQVDLRIGVKFKTSDESPLWKVVNIKNNSITLRNEDSGTLITKSKE